MTTLNGTGTRNRCRAASWDDALVEGFTPARAGLPRALMVWAAGRAGLRAFEGWALDHLTPLSLP